MNNTTPIDSLFPGPPAGKFLTEPELQQIQQDLSFLIQENKKLSSLIENYQPSDLAAPSPPPIQDNNSNQPLTPEQLLQIEQLKKLTPAQLKQLSQHQLDQLLLLKERARIQKEEEKQKLEKEALESLSKANELLQPEVQKSSINDPLSVFHTSKEYKTPCGETVKVSIDLQLIYLMLFIILVILILKK